MRSSLVVAPFLFVLVACGTHGAAAGPELAQTQQTLVGTWGAERVRLDGATTGARIQLDCLLARTDEAIRLDDAGAFSIVMAFEPLRGVQIDSPEHTPPSRVTGRVERNVLHLTIGSQESEANETFTLQRNGKATLPNCRLRS